MVAELEVKIRCAVDEEAEQDKEMFLPMVIQTWADGRQGEMAV